MCERGVIGVSPPHGRELVRAGVGVGGVLPIDVLGQVTGREGRGSCAGSAVWFPAVTVQLGERRGLTDAATILKARDGLELVRPSLRGEPGATRSQPTAARIVVRAAYQSYPRKNRPSTDEGSLLRSWR